MKKQEALSFIKKQMGYVPHNIISTIYNDDDEIPQGLVDLICTEITPKPYVIYYNAVMAKAIREAVADCYKIL